MNIIVASSAWREDDVPLLFGEEEVIMCEHEDLARLCVDIGAYPSTSKARQAGRKGPIPDGWTEMKANRKVHIWIWNPTE